jgi:hypothetical protein
MRKERVRRPPDRLRIDSDMRPPTASPARTGPAKAGPWRLDIFV